MSVTQPVTRTRTFTGTLPETGQPVLVHLHEEAPTVTGEWKVLGMEVALKDGEGRFSRWGVPATMTEET